MIDFDQLEAMAAGAPELVLEILDDFATESPPKLIRAAIAKPAVAKEIYHQLSGSAGLLGLSELYEVLHKLENTCLHHPPSPTEGLEKLLLESVQEAKCFLKDGA